VVCFARAGDGNNAGLLRGSGRSIPGLHLRDCLDLVAKREPGLILRFGGHAQAAGLTLRERDFERFAGALERAAEYLALPPAAMARTRALCRSRLRELFDEQQEATFARFVDDWFSVETQGAMHALVERLRAKSAP